MTAPDDIGALTAEICLFQPTIVNSVVYTAGDTISYARLADTVRPCLAGRCSGSSGRCPGWNGSWPGPPTTSSCSTAWRLPDGTGVSWDMDRTFNAQQSIGVVDVEQWMRANLT